MERDVLSVRCEFKLCVQYNVISRKFKHITLSATQTSVSVPYYTRPVFSKILFHLVFQKTVDLKFNVLWDVVPYNFVHRYRRL
jgi:hypothetical protein